MTAITVRSALPVDSSCWSTISLRFLPIFSYGKNYMENRSLMSDSL